MIEPVWIEVRLTGLPRSDLDSVSARLFALGASGVQEDWMPGAAPEPVQPWEQRALAEPDPLVLTAWFDQSSVTDLRTALAPLELEMAIAPLEPTDWDSAWRASIEPIRIDQDLVIAPPWDAAEGALVIEPGQGFGTGRHPTTRQALVAVQLLAPGLATALDVGCGSGILALAAARHGLTVEGVDVQASAIDEAKRHAVTNGLPVAFSTQQVASLSQARDLVLANLHAELAVQLAHDLRRLTGRWLVVAGILEDKEASVVDALAPLEVAHREQDGPWVCLHFRWPT